jgi:hypothetical protein
VIRRGPDSPCNFGATSPEPVTTAAPPRRECARRGLDPIPPPNRKDETMQDTVDQAYGAVPRTLANIIEDARRAAGEADARPPGVWDLWIARLAGQGSRLDRRERRRGAEPFRRLPRSRPRAPGGDCRRDAWRPARASVRLPRPLGRNSVARCSRSRIDWTSSSRPRTAVRAVRPHHSTTVMGCHVCAGATWDGVPDRGQP